MLKLLEDGGLTLKIAQVAPLYESVPPHSYGGTERVVSYLVEELVRQGHNVTLFASGDSTTRANLVSACERSLRLSSDCADPLTRHTILLDEVFSRSSEFDILHFHTDYWHFPFSRLAGVPNVTTLHGRLDLPDLQPLYQHFHDIPLVSISKAQRAPLMYGNWVGNVYHGLPPRLHSLHEHSGDYLAFLGRISPEKGLDRAIRIARRAGMRLKIAAKIDKVDRAYFAEEIAPLLEQPGIEYVGEITEREKGDFLGNAHAYLFPIEWPEPFGLTMIEAMACGTPTIAFRRGSVPEVLESNISGFIVDTEDEALDAIKCCEKFDRRLCRAVFLKRFTDKRMAEEYLAIYQKLAENDISIAPPRPLETDSPLVP
jgi:glycosyltransferase involved in cell wall biosynthesis